MSLFKLSPFVETQFNKHKELKNLLEDHFDLKQDWNTYRATHQNADIFSLMRNYRQSRLALIAAKDHQYNEISKHLNTLKLTSQLARILINYAYQYANNEMYDKYGDVMDGSGKKQDFIIFTLGKLGGNELNFSSDVDLVFCYSGQGQSDGKKQLDAHSYYQKLGRRIIHLLDTVTADGIVYRVDMRLRPFGSAAPLVCSTDHLIDYLESEGRDWERYAWLRASFIANNQVLAQSLLKQIEPFIYRKYLDYNIFESLRQIKAQIIRQQEKDLNNLKLGIGGIREIEFIIQTLQLTFGGRNKQLRGNDLWLQMQKLCHFEQLSATDMELLQNAWLFLRKLENLCQIIHDRDSHHLPDSESSMQYLSSCMGTDDPDCLLQRLQRHKNKVHQIFKNMFLYNKSHQKELYHPEIQQIKDEIAQRNFPRSSKHKIYAALNALIPFLDEKKATTQQNSIVIGRYYQVINAISKRPSYLSMLIESPVILKKLIKQIRYSHFFSEKLSRNPALLEALFDQMDKTDFDIAQQWRVFCQKHTIKDDEEYLSLLCQFKQYMQFKTVMAYISHLNDVKTTQLILTGLAEKILSLVTIQAWKDIRKTIESDINVNDLIIIAYGSLAMKNMHLNSDFDIVFILDQEINEHNHKFIMRWIKRIILLLSIPTYSGTLYQLDTQLRPNGKSGSPIINQKNFESYQKNEAWVWEHAALIKSRAVYATKQQELWFNDLRRHILTQPRDPEKVDRELEEMGHKIQQFSQKDHQQEFGKLALILKKAHKTPEIINHIITNDILNKKKLDESIIKA